MRHSVNTGITDFSNYNAAMQIMSNPKETADSVEEVHVYFDETLAASHEMKYFIRRSALQAEG